MNRADLSSQKYDSLFEKIDGLTWLPWVGRNFDSAPKKLLIVGESHYFKGDSPQARELDRKAYENPESTRIAVDNLGWGTKTWKNLSRILFKTCNIDDQRFWSNTAFYNFIQRPMDDYTKERPSDDDKISGWKTFMDVVRHLKPTYCLFLGVESFNRFNHCMSRFPVGYEDVEWTEKISGTYGRKAVVSIDGQKIELIGIQHPGARISWGEWNEYLIRNYSGLMKSLAAKNYPKV